MRFHYLPILFLVFLALGCQESEILTPRTYPLIQTQGVSKIDKDGATLSIQLKQTGSNAIESYGVDYLETKLQENIYIKSEFLRKEIKGTPEEKVFSVTIDTDLTAGEEYVARPFVKFKEKTIYGETVKFVAQGSRTPEITEVNSSVLGMWFEFEIKGKYFSSRLENNQVRVPGTEEFLDIQLLEARTDFLKVRSLRKFNFEDFISDKRYDLVVTTLGKSTVLPGHFRLGVPRIVSINTLKAKVGDELLVELDLEREGEFMYLTLDYQNQSKYVLLLLRKVQGKLYRTVLTDFPLGIYSLGLLMEGSFTVYPEKFEVVSD